MRIRSHLPVLSGEMLLQLSLLSLSLSLFFFLVYFSFFHEYYLYSFTGELWIFENPSPCCRGISFTRSFIFIATVGERFARETNAKLERTAIHSKWTRSIFRSFVLLLFPICNQSDGTARLERAQLDFDFRTRKYGVRRCTMKSQRSQIIRYSFEIATEGEGGEGRAVN